jgi:DNA-directed RNA polymerase subunit RPC12/RpoP
MDSEADPYDILPDDFLDVWDAETIPEALEAAERAKSTTPREEMKQCPECSSVKLRHKPGRSGLPSRPERYKCRRCKTHFDQAEIGGRLDCGGESDPAADAIRDEGQLSLDEVHP